MGSFQKVIMLVHGSVLLREHYYNNDNDSNKTQDVQQEGNKVQALGSRAIAGSTIVIPNHFAISGLLGKKKEKIHY